MNELWIGVAEVITEPNLKTGNTLGFTNVVAWAESESGYIEAVNSALAGYGWTILSLEKIRPIAPESGFSESRFSDEIDSIIERAKLNPSACIFGTLHYYPSRPK